MNWNLWNYLTAITFALALVFATCASIYVRRVLRRTPVPLTNEISSVPDRAGEAAQTRTAGGLREAAWRQRLLTPDDPLMAFSIPAAFFTVGCFYISAASSTCTAPSRPSGRFSGSSP